MEANGALEALRERLAELNDLEMLGRLAAWDQRTMMPPQGAPARGHQMATLEKVAHALLTAPDIGEWLDALDGAELGEIDADVVRLARRDWDRRRRVPPELAAELERAGSEGQQVWQEAREANDFAAFAPALERNVVLAREHAACFEDYAQPYDALLADYDHGLTAERIKDVFGVLAEALPPLVERGAAAAPAPMEPPQPPDEEQAVERILTRLGADPAGWRIDVAAHPFSIAMGPGDSRVTTRFAEGPAFAVIAAMHEFGHALYERQVAPELARTNLGSGTSMSIHESQSKLFENHVGRNRAFAPVIAAELGADPAALHAELTAVRPGVIRVSADQVTYPLHIVLRFELECALIQGTLAVADLPSAWSEGARRLLGVEVPDAASGVLQDPHWAAGAFGYFPSYALGCLIAAQLWEALETDVGAQDEALGAGDVVAVRDWLREHVHAYGRRLDTEPLVERATGRGLDPGPFIRHLTAIASSTRT
jgi:carboxypeptidase Taq